jgi:hypothetical protein
MKQNDLLQKIQKANVFAQTNGQIITFGFLDGLVVSNVLIILFYVTTNFSGVICCLFFPRLYTRACTDTGSCQGAKQWILGIKLSSTLLSYLGPLLIEDALLACAF